MLERFSTLTVAAIMAVALSCHARAGEFPDQPVDYIIPFNAGGESDLSARLQQTAWDAVAGVPVTIEYQPGEGGAKAWASLNSLKADGYTIMGINLPHTILQPIEGDVGYRTEDLTPIYYFHYTPDAIIVPKDSPFATLQDLIDYAREYPDKLTFSGSGMNSSNSLAHARFDQLAGVRTRYVPFGGTGPAVTAMLDGETMAGFNYTTSGTSQGEAIRILAVAAERRLPAFRDLPTFRESGYELVGGAFRGIAVPASTPEPIRRKLSEIVGKINGDPEFVAKMEEAGFVMANVPYENMPEFIARKKAEYEAIGRYSISQKQESFPASSPRH